MGNSKVGSEQFFFSIVVSAFPSFIHRFEWVCSLPEGVEPISEGQRGSS